MPRPACSARYLEVSHIRYFFDTEFIEDGKTIDLLSIGVVCEETGETFYAENADADWTLASQWVRDNVLPNMVGSTDPSWTPHAEIGPALLLWLDGQQSKATNTKIQFWAYYADYDWVAMCQLFGTMMDLPQGFPMYCMDVKQLCMMLGNPALPEQTNVEHNALNDAWWTLGAFNELERVLARDYGHLAAREMLHQERR